MELARVLEQGFLVTLWDPAFDENIVRIYITLFPWYFINIQSVGA